MRPLPRRNRPEHSESPRNPPRFPSLPYYLELEVECDECNERISQIDRVLILHNRIWSHPPALREAALALMEVVHTSPSGGRNLGGAVPGSFGLRGKQGARWSP